LNNEVRTCDGVDNRYISVQIPDQMHSLLIVVVAFVLKIIQLLYPFLCPSIHFY
jgi:hypothetical protein